MADSANIVLFGLGKVGKTTLTNVIKEEKFGEDYMPTDAKIQTEYSRTIDGTEIKGIIFEEPGESFKNLKATVSTYASNGDIHVFIAPQDGPNDFKFCQRYSSDDAYNDSFSDDKLFVMLITKKDLGDIPFAGDAKQVAEEKNGLYFEVDLHDKAAVDNILNEILRKYCEKKGITLGGSGKGGKDKGAKKDKGEKKGGCVFL